MILNWLRPSRSKMVLVEVLKVRRNGRRKWRLILHFQLQRKRIALRTTAMTWRQMTGLKPYWSNLTNPFLTCLKTRRPSVILLCRRLHRTTDRACKVLTLEGRMVVAKVLLQVRILLSNRRRPSPSSVQTSGRRSGRDRTRCRPPWVLI